jgi:hypothetical protein
MTIVLREARPGVCPRQVIRQRAAKGAEALDVFQPRWWRKVDGVRLDMSSFTNDVLAKASGRNRDEPGTYAAGLDLLGIRGSGADLGFTLFVAELGRPELWILLTEAWVEEWAERAGREGLR